MHIAVVGLSHRTTPVEIRERLSISEQIMENSLQTLRSDEQVLEASILSTCNRLEIYTLVRHPEQGVSAIGSFLSRYSGIEPSELCPHLFSYHHDEAVNHLLRVAAGLDSLVLGEGQILAQVKKMYRLAQEHNSVGPILNRLLNQAVSTGKRVRSETSLGTGAVSISSAAVELAQLKIGQSRGYNNLVSLEGEQVAVIGAGRMSRLLLQHLQAKGCTGVVLINRTIERARILANEFPDLPVQCRALEALDYCLSTCSLIFTSTAAAAPIIDAARLSGLNRRSSLKLVDIGVPRNIASDVKEVTGVDLYDVDDLAEVVARNQESRKQVAAEAEDLLKEESRLFLEWWDGLEAVPTINRLRIHLEGIRKQELEKALNRMGVECSDREKKVVEALSKGIVNKILHMPITNLRAFQPRQQRHEALRALQSLFELDLSVDS
uniref:Glutamyl-tRNA reductase n=1 Tax=Paulinella longichromatophora TaxID=1708747 RepID=A0A2H4ZNF7_9EUKA|nr:glutamyl-tRNA reductase [Paulinella longichromatophora]